MDSRSKYAALPFVAVGEQDLYETDDLPEADQLPTRSQQPWDASVEELPCGTLDVFKKFADSEAGQLEMVTTKETPLQKYERLQSELEELIGMTKTDSESGDLIDKVNQMSLKLQNFYVSPVQDNKVLQSVSNQIEKSKTKLKISDKPNEKAEEVKYQLWLKPGIGQLDETTKVNTLEQRIKRIEDLIGGDDQKFSLLTNFTNDKNLVNAVQVLSSKVAHLDSSHLEKIDARLHMIIDKLSQISERKAQLDEVERNSKIVELHNLIFKNEKQLAAVPHLLERLECLNELHEQAIQFSSALSYIDNLQIQVAESLKNNEKQLVSVKQTIAKNNEEIRNVLDSFEQRIKQLH